MTNYLWCFLLAANIFLGSSLARCQDPNQLHRVDPKSPEGLRHLFAYDAQAIPLLSAHRGGAMPGYPENCIATFAHTLRHAFSILEIDLRQTEDGRIVLHHDASLERTTTGSGPVGARTLRELKQLRLKDSEGRITEHRIPTLDETLQWARGKTIVVLDKKDVPVEICVKKIEEHRAEGYAMIMAYSFQDVRRCHQLNRDIMMEVMIGDRDRFRGFINTGVPWKRVVAFVGHAAPEDKGLIDMIHAQGALCMAGTSRNLDRRLRAAADSQLEGLQAEYQARLALGIDIVETDLPISVANLLFREAEVTGAKSKYFHDPADGLR